MFNQQPIRAPRVSQQIADDDRAADLSVDDSRTDTDPREKGDDDGQEYGDPRDARDERDR